MTLTFIARQLSHTILDTLPFKYSAFWLNLVLFICLRISNECTSVTRKFLCIFNLIVRVLITNFTSNTQFFTLVQENNIHGYQCVDHFCVEHVL